MLKISNLELNVSSIIAHQFPCHGHGSFQEYIRDVNCYQIPIHIENLSKVENIVKLVFSNCLYFNK